MVLPDAVGDAAVEAHIGDAEHGVVGVLPGEMALGIGEQLVKVVEMLGAGIGGGELRHRRLDQQARLEEIEDRRGAERAGIGIGQHQPRHRLAHIDPGAMADVEAAGHLEQPSASRMVGVATEKRSDNSLTLGRRSPAASALSWIRASTCSARCRDSDTGAFERSERLIFTESPAGAADKSVTH